MGRWVDELVLVVLGSLLVWLVYSEGFRVGGGCHGGDRVSAAIASHPRGWELSRGDVVVDGVRDEVWVRARSGGWARFAPWAVGAGCWRAVYLGTTE